ncbi:MAG: sensor histidine kinase [Bacteroidetes bacterium]|nr:MAG: sensor histidine kinase [Bacteroidota bacterium]
MIFLVIKNSEWEIVILLSVGTAVVMVLAIAIISFVFTYQRKLIKHKMEMQLLENEHRRKLLVANIETQENERNRIAKDLHDDVGAMLSTTKMFLGVLAKNSNNPEMVKKIDEMISNATHKLRTISHNITPKNLENFGFVKAVEDSCAKMNDADTLSISFKYNTEARFNVSQELNLYRIVQELLNNTLKHAEATEVIMQLSIQEDTVTFAYQDNGKGVDIEALKNRERLSLGISNLESRAEALNSKIELKSAKMDGFLARISFKMLPYEKN